MDNVSIVMGLNPDLTDNNLEESFRTNRRKL